jgi:hypothetical protein
MAISYGYADPATAFYESQRCADDMTWAGSSCGIGHAAGEVTC